MPSKIAICQITSTNSPSHNLAISEALVRKAVAAGAKAVFFPEASDFIAPTQAECYALSQHISEHEYTLGLQAIAKELGVYICAGIHDLPGEDEPEYEDSKKVKKVFNSHVAIEPSGKVISLYRKLHLFDIHLKDPSAPPPVPNPDGTFPPIKKVGESDRIFRGTHIPEILDFKGLGIGGVGLEICYDIRFPEIHTILVRKGAKVLVIPSAFTLKTGKDHWYTLLKATSIQYQSYVLAPAQAGAHDPTRSSWGETLAFDPWGKELGRLDSIDDFEKNGGDRKGPMPEEFLMIEMDEAAVDSVREQIPLAIQKRSDVYGVVGEGH